MMMVFNSEANLSENDVCESIAKIAIIYFYN